MDEESRAKRTAALEEKKRRLEELKRRRQAAAAAAAATPKKVTTSTSGVAASSPAAVGLDDYIDGLLKNPVPTVPGLTSPSSFQNLSSQTAASSAITTGTLTTSTTTTTTAEAAAVTTAESIGSTSVGVTPSTPGVSTSVGVTSVSTSAAVTPVAKVETFTAGTQTEEDDFPPELISESTTTTTTSSSSNNEKNQATTKESTEESESNDDNAKEAETENDENTNRQPKILSPEEKQKAIASDPFATFFVQASKKVERLLGAPVLADLLVDTDYDITRRDLDDEYDNDEEPTTQKNKIKNTTDDASYGLVSGRATYEYSKWTNSRDITCMDWSPTHKELIVTGYHMPGATTILNTNGTSNSNSSSSSSSIINNNSSSSSSNALQYYDKSTAAGAAATRTKKSFLPNRPSAPLIPKPGETQQADGLALVWSLAMTNRPEHIFTCGSPLLCTKFHPTESHLLVGGTHSGQLVVWDHRMGRLPVQRSSLSTVANKLKGHSHPICSLEVAEGGSGLVTADTNGKVNFWSLANLRDPAESINLSGCNISSLAVAPETNTILVGDEIGGLQSILPSNLNATGSSSTTNATNSTTTASSSSSRNTSTGRRTVKRMNGGHNDQNGHFGMITGISTKVRTSTMPGHHHHHHHHHNQHHSVARGFVTGSQGLVLTCGVDWSTKLWAPAYKDTPILSFFSHCYDYMADVQWSPSNPTVFATASCQGKLGLWNLAGDLDEPLTGPEGIAMEVGGAGGGGMNKLKWSSDGRRIAVASSDRLHVLGMTEEVSKPKAEDENKMMNNLTSRGFLEDL